MPASNNFNLKYRIHAASGLRASIQFSTRYTHKVNLRAVRAADNARSRDINLSVDTSYRRLGANFTHVFGVGARRTIYDFDRQLSRGESDRRSNIRRHWSMRHSLQRSLGGHLHLNAGYTHRADDSGKLIGEEGVQLLDEAGANQSLRLGLRYSSGETFSCAASYSYTLDRDWQYDFLRREDPRQLVRSSRHRMLRAEVSYAPAGDNALRISGSRSQQRSGTFDNWQVVYTRQI